MRVELTEKCTCAGRNSSWDAEAQQQLDTRADLRHVLGGECLAVHDQQGTAAQRQQVVAGADEAIRSLREAVRRGV